MAALKSAEGLVMERRIRHCIKVRSKRDQVNGNFRNYRPTLRNGKLNGQPSYQFEPNTRSWSALQSQRILTLGFTVLD